MLPKGAEITIGLGTVSIGRESREYFQVALRYLRAASILPNFSLPDNLQRYVGHVYSPDWC